MSAAGVPSALLWVGAVDPAKFDSGAPLPSLHSSGFAPDRERTLRMGVTTLVVSALQMTSDHSACRVSRR